MKFEHHADYPAAVDVVFAQLASTEFQDAKCAATTTGQFSTSVEAIEDGAQIRTERTLPSDGLPSAAKSFVGDTLTIVEVQTWGGPAQDGSREGTLDVRITGAPMSLRGTLRLIPRDGGTTHQIDADLKASVPLIGGKLEKAAAGPLLRAAKVETTLLAKRVREL